MHDMIKIILCSYVYVSLRAASVKPEKRSYHILRNYEIHVQVSIGIFSQIMLMISFVMKNGIMNI